MLQDDVTIGEEGILHTWDNFDTTHDALVSTSMNFGEFFETMLTKFLLATDVPEEDKDSYMAVLAYQGDPRNAGLVNADKSRFEIMKTDSGKLLGYSWCNM